VDFFSLEQALRGMMNIPGTECIHKEEQSSDENNLPDYAYCFGIYNDLNLKCKIRFLGI
jgi:hypothetical protein